MFWGLVVQPNKKYSKTVSTAFHVSQAVLDVNSTPGDGDVQLILKSDKVDYILCTLNKGERVQMPLNLVFSEGDEISFRSVGGTIHLTGYLVDEQNFAEYEEGEPNEEEVPTLADVSKQRGKRQVRQESSDSESADSGTDGEDDVNEVVDDDSDDESLEESENDSDEEPAPPPKLSKLNNGMPNGVSKKENKTKEGKQKKRQQTVEQSDGKKSNPKPTSSGLTIEELREGKGAEVKIGRKVQVYYEGRFISNNKIFDKTNSGKGFEFVVGRGNVIRGWDVGVLGMRAGGKRRLICAPNMAYGKKGSPPAIPPNATLVFDIEMRNVL